MTILSCVVVRSCILLFGATLNIFYCETVQIDMNKSGDRRDITFVNVCATTNLMSRKQKPSKYDYTNKQYRTKMIRIQKHRNITSKTAAVCRIQ